MHRPTDRKLQADMTRGWVQAPTLFEVQLKKLVTPGSSGWLRFTHFLYESDGSPMHTAIHPRTGPVCPVMRPTQCATFAGSEPPDVSAGACLASTPHRRRQQTQAIVDGLDRMRLPRG